MKKTTSNIVIKIFFISLVCVLPLLRGVGVCSAQNVAINATGATPNASALLDIDAAPTNDKGLLIPRVSLTQTTSNTPIGAGIATSLLVYNIATINDVTPGYYYWGGAAWVRFATGSGGGTTVSMQTFTSSGTYTPTAGTQYVVVHMVGGGAGGWNAGSGNNSGAGGGAGEYATNVFSAAVIGVSQPITIGVGGAPNTAGGTTSFGTLLTAVGAPAANSYLGGIGGVGGTGGGLHVQGGSGANGAFAFTTSSPSSFFMYGGNGGASYFGSGGRGGTGNIDPGQSGNAYGSGGGGNGYFSNAWGANAGAGAAGVVIIYEYQ